MAIKFDITGDNTNFLNALQGAESGVRSTARTVEAAGGDIEGMFKRIQTVAASAFAGFSASQIIKTIVQTRGEFQQLEVAFQTMLGSADKATAMVSNLQKLAATTPFDMQGVANGAKQLLAYGVQANDVVDTMRRLGDISAGLSLDLKDLAWLYGTTLTQGRMFTMDLRQFQARGIPMAEELAKIFGVTKNEVAGLVTAGKVGSKEVTQAIKNMTSEGSKFGGLMEAQSHTITGQISNIEDSVSMAMNDLGKQQEGVINTGLGIVSTLVEHWQEVAKAIGTVVAAYGLYKGALMATVAIQNVMSKQNFSAQSNILDEEIAATKALLPVKKSEANADLAAMVAKKQLTQAQAEEIAMKRQELEVTKQQAAANQMGSGLDAQIEALKALSTSKEDNIDADLREAVASNTITQAQAQEIQGKRELLASLQQEAEARVALLQAKAEDAQKTYESAVKNQAAASMDLDSAEAKVKAAKEALDSALEAGDVDAQASAQTQLKTAVDEENAAAERLKAASADVSTAATEMNTASEAANTAQNELNAVSKGTNATATTATTVATETSTAVTGENTIAMRLNSIQTRAATIVQGLFAASVNSVKMAWNGLKVAMATNPIGLILTGITVAISLFTSFADSEDEATDANERFGESMTKASADVESLYAVMESSTTTSKVHKDAVEQLSQKAEEYGLKLDSEKDKTEQLIEKKQELIGLIKEESIERQKANDIQTATDEYQKKIEDIKNDLKDSLSDDLSDVQKNQLVNLISDEDIKNLQDKMEAMNKAMEVSVAKTGSWNSRFSTDQIQAYNDAVAKLTNRIGIYSEKLGLSSYETTKNKNAVKDQTTVMAEASIEMQRTINATQAAAQAANDAATGADNMSDSQRAAAVQAAYLRQTTEELYSSIAQLLKDYSNNNINFTLTLDTTQVPKWMKDQLGINGKGGNQKEAHYRASYWATQLDWINKHPRNTGRMISGKWYTKDMIAERAAQYAVADSTIKTDTATSSANKPKKTTVHKTPKKNTSKDDAADRAENLKEENEKWKEEQLKQQREAEYAIEEAAIAQIKDAGEKERRERALQHRKDLDQLDEQKKEFQRQNYEHNKTIFENSGSKKKNKYSGSVDKTALTTAQQQTLDAQRKKIEEEWNAYQLQQLKQQAIAEQQAMDDYLSKYGTFQEHKYAIEQEYAQKIKDVEEGVGTEEEKKWKINSLKRERDSSISSVDASNLAMGIDWSVAFKGVGNVLSDIAKETLSKIEEYMKTDEFKKLSPENKKAYTDFRQNLQTETGGSSTSAFNFKIWGQVANDVKAYQNAVKNLREKTDAHTKAVDELEKAQKNLADATDDTSKGIAQANVVIAKQNVDTTGSEQEKAKEDAQTAQNNLTDSSNKAANGISNFASYLSEMNSGSLYGFANGITKLITSLSKGANGFGKALDTLGGKIGGIIGAILQILDALGDDPKGFINGLFEKITTTIDTILSDLPELVGSVVKDVGGLIGGVVEGIGSMFGAKDGWLTGSNEKEVAETTKSLTNSNEALTSAIDSLKDSIDKSGGRTAVNSYEQAYKDQQEVNKNTMDILRAQMGYHGSHHSNAYYWNLSSEDYASINETLAQYAREHPDQETSRNNAYSLQDIYELTPEQMNAIATHNVEIWQKMLDAGKYDKSEYWKNYIALAGQLEELTEKINENLTQISFDSLKSNFVSDVMDMTKTWSDFTNDFTEMIAKAWTNAAVNDLMSDDLQKFYNGWAAKMKSGTLTKNDIENLRSEYEKLVNQALDIRDTMTEVTGYTGNDNQSASSNGISSISYDQSNKIVGLVTAGNIITQNISDNVVVAVSAITSLNTNITSQNGTLSEIRNLMIFNNSYLEDTLKFVKFIYNEFSVKLDKANEYLKKMN